MSSISALIGSVQWKPSSRISLAVLGAWTVLLTILGYLVLVKPGHTYVAVFLNDVFGIIDGFYRTSIGQIPSVDFKTLYGAATWYPGGLAMRLGFDAANALTLMHLVTASVLAVMACLVCARRFPLLPSVMFIGFVFCLVLVPMRLGGVFWHVTHGIFYTRYGWAALAIALLFYADPTSKSRSGAVIDTAVLACLMLYALYLKITFGAVVVGFVIVNAVTSSYNRRISLSALGIFVLALVVIELVSGYNSAYFSDVFGVIEGAPTPRGGRRQFWSVAEHAGVFLLCLSALVVAYVSGRRRFFDFAFLVGCIVASIMILRTSGGYSKGLPALAAVFLVLGEFTRRQGLSEEAGAREGTVESRIAAIAIFTMMFAFIAEPTVVRVRSLLHGYIQISMLQKTGEIGVMGVLSDPRNRLDPTLNHDVFGHDPAGHQMYNSIRRSDVPAGEYSAIVAEGVELLRDSVSADATVLSIEQTSAFSAALGLRPPANSKPFDYSKKRDTSGEQAAMQQFFSDARYVMVPEVPYSKKHLEVLIEAYGPYLDEHFIEYRRSPHWRLYRRR